MPTPSKIIVPYGYCHCECGQKTPIANRDLKRLGWVKGEPKRFIPGHHTRQARVPPLTSSVPAGASFIVLTKGQIAIVDPEDFVWLNQWAWFAHRSGGKRFYAVRHIASEKNTIRMHRLILGLGSDDPQKGDHINRNTLDNRRINLRVANNSQNAQNASLRVDNKIGMRGVSWHKATRTWMARITINCQTIILGYFATPEEAKAAYNQAAITIHKDFYSFG